MEEDFFIEDEDDEYDDDYFSSLLPIRDYPSEAYLQDDSLWHPLLDDTYVSEGEFEDELGDGQNVSEILNDRFEDEDVILIEDEDSLVHDPDRQLDRGLEDRPVYPLEGYPFVLSIVYAYVWWIIEPVVVPIFQYILDHYNEEREKYLAAMKRKNKEWDKDL